MRILWISTIAAASGCTFDPQLHSNPGGGAPDASAATPDAFVAALDVAPAGCPVAYAASFGTHKYRLTDKDYGWADAQAQCQTDGGHLIKIETREEDDFLVNAINAADHAFVWIGLSDPASNDTYRWTDGSQLGTFQHFSFGIIPSSSDNCIDKSTTDIDGRWFTFDCTHQQRGVCECDG
jgi:lectin-like protein